MRKKFKIESVYFLNFRHFKELTVEFNEKFNFIAGPNGCGKTSILSAIAHCFSSDNSISRFDKESKIWTDISLKDKKYRVGFGRNSFEYKGYRTNSISRLNTPDLHAEKISLSINDAKNVVSEYIPLFIGSHRFLRYQRIDGLKREPDKDAAIRQYFNDGINYLYGNSNYNVKQWFINRYFVIEKDWAKEEAENFRHLIQNLPKIAPVDSDFKYVKTERDLEPIFSIYGKECYLEEISSGFQAIFQIICTIVEWIEVTRSEGNRSIKEASGTVLIDELDIHLHPEWQFTIRDSLESIFPNLQFIVTTHSPHLLTSAKNNEVIALPNPKDLISNRVISPSHRSYAGWNTDQVLKDLMGVKSIENKKYENLLSKSFDAIKNQNIDDLKKLIAELDYVAHPNDTVVTILKTKLASLILK